MSCKVKCSDNNRDYQPFPTSGQLATKNQRNLSLEELLKHIAKQDVVYSYVMTSAKYRAQKLWHCGSGPNFQGDLITLCTCKHRMRSSLCACGWKGKWIAGFTGINEHKRKNWLVYLMQISEAFESHYDLWSSKLLRSTRPAKAGFTPKTFVRKKSKNKPLVTIKILDPTSPIPYPTFNPNDNFFVLFFVIMSNF